MRQPGLRVRGRDFNLAGIGLIQQCQAPAGERAFTGEEDPDALQIEGDRQHQATCLRWEAIASPTAACPQRLQKSPNPSVPARAAAKSEKSGSRAAPISPRASRS